MTCIVPRSPLLDRRLRGSCPHSVPPFSFIVSFIHSPILPSVREPCAVQGSGDIAENQPRSPPLRSWQLRAESGNPDSHRAGQ